MSSIETILSRMMNEPKFAELLFNNPDQVLAEYDLSAEEYTKLKELSQAEFGVLAVEGRKSMAKLDGNLQIATFYWGTS